MVSQWNKYVVKCLHVASNQKAHFCISRNAYINETVLVGDTLDPFIS